jgi:N-acyl-D-amino-acid deacylase
MGLAERGVIAAGYFADLVLFDAATVQDNATLQNPTALSSGIERVWVNGRVVYQNQQCTKQYSGKLLRRN